eukprot:4781049-Pleurochrysis_carterae.AAC.6
MYQNRLRVVVRACAAPTRVPAKTIWDRSFIHAVFQVVLLLKAPAPGESAGFAAATLTAAVSPERSTWRSGSLPASGVEGCRSARLRMVPVGMLLQIPNVHAEMTMNSTIWTTSSTWKKKCLAMLT